MDIYRDLQLKHIYNITKEIPEIRNMVKTAEIKEADLKELSPHCFAWESERMFRVDTPAHTTLSLIYMEKNSNQVPLFVQNRIKTAAQIFNIKIPRMEKRAHYKENYIFPEERRYNVQNAEQVKLAEQRLLETKNKIPFIKYVQACNNLVKYAQEFKVEVSEEIKRNCAGDLECNTKLASECIRDRARFVKDDKLKNKYNELSDGVSKIALLSKDGIIKLASALHQLDEKSGVDSLYDKQIDNPVRVMFNTKKAAASINLAGQSVSLAKLMSIDPDTYDNIIPGIKDEISDNGSLDPEKLLTVLPTLPKDILNQFVKQVCK